MKIAFIGQKGMPATFGGVEYHVDHLSRGLVAAGHEALVYVRPWYTEKGVRSFHGVKLARVATIKTKHLDASVHSFLCSIHVLFQNQDVIHYHGIGPSFFSVIPRLFRKKVVATVHRLDWQTEKWGPIARLLLRVGERISATVPNAAIVVSRDLEEYFLREYGKDTARIAHAIDLPRRRAATVIREKYGLAGKDYLLFMGRLVPEKRVDWLIRSFCELGEPAGRSHEMKLVIAGGSGASDEHVRALESLRGERPDIIFTGYVTGEEKEELLSNALALVLPSYLEGFPVVLLEARSHGICCLASDIPPHRETITSGYNGLLFHAADRADLTRKLQLIFSDPVAAEQMGRRAREEMATRPGWDEVVRQTLEVYQNVVRPRSCGR